MVRSTSQKRIASALLLSTIAVQLHVSGAWAALQSIPAFSPLISVQGADAQAATRTFSSNDELRVFVGNNAGGTVIDTITSIRNDAPTAQKVCAMAGYNTVSSRSCTDTDGRCNYTSCGDNFHQLWNGSSWSRVGACGGQWLAQLTCSDPTNVGGGAQCQDGIDNDNDGKIDALVTGTSGGTGGGGGGNFIQEGADPKYNKTWITTITCRNPTSGTNATFGNGDAQQMAQLVSLYIRNEGLNLTQPQQAIVRSDGGANWDAPGTFHTPTLNAVCQILGDHNWTYVSSTCRDNERSGTYPTGKCNFHSPGDNNMHRFSGTLTTPTGCSDGIDNDNDGRIDLNDTGCASANDLSEIMHDPQCTGPTDTTESDAACSDGIDNDGDGATDFPADFSCTSATDNDETNQKASCQDGIDNDGDGLIDTGANFCGNLWKNGSFDQGNTNITTPYAYNSLSSCVNSDSLLPDYAQYSIVTNPNRCHRGFIVGNSRPFIIFNGGGGSEFLCQTLAVQPNKTYTLTVSEILLNSNNPAALSWQANGQTIIPQLNATMNWRTRTGTWSSGQATSVRVCGVNPGTVVLGNDWGVNDIQFALSGAGGTCTAAADPGCANNQDNNESNAAACQDGIDNDGDGATDFPNDFSCTSATDNDETNLKAACQDGLDNDNDGRTDFPQDPGCVSAQDNDEFNQLPQCGDGIDNDNDGATDFPADFSCSSPTDTDETNPKAACQDGIDNDGDGKADYPQDPGCANKQDNDESSDGGHPINVTCPNGQPAQFTGYKLSDEFPVQNGTPGAVFDTRSVSIPVSAGDRFFLVSYPVGSPLQYHYTDDEVLLSTGFPGVTITQNYSAGNLCNGGHKTDPVDITGLFQGPLNSTYQTLTLTATFKNICGSPVYHTPYYVHVARCSTQCSDGIDNDGDGAIDTQDFSCSGSNDNDETNLKAACQDGLDNDNDGRTDFPNDPGCVSRQDNDENNNVNITSIVANGCNVTVSYSKNVATCVHLLTASNNQITHAGNIFCNNNGPVTVPTSSFNNLFQVGTQVKLCHGNDYNDCSSPVTITGNTQCVIPQCQDGIDNDGDGATDFPNDFSCTSATDNDETNQKAACQDGLDNDGDGLRDFPQDPGCVSAQDNDEFNVNAPKLDIEKTAPAQATAGGTITYSFVASVVGNQTATNVTVSDFFIDSNGYAINPPFTFVSAQGASCQYKETATHKMVSCALGTLNPGAVVNFTITFSVPATGFCGQTIMNQADIWESTLTQSVADWDKAMTTVVCAPPQCQDGIDNDGDGATDFPNDFSCTSATDNDETNLKAACQDGLDNDGDGLRDFPQDPGCVSRQDNDEFNAPLGVCRDGLDNDADGRIDLQDPGCSNADDTNEGDEAACQDRRDNDFDGLVDFPFDPGCSSPTDNDETNQVQTVDLSIVKSGPTSVVRGQTIYYTIQVGNGGTTQATNVTITDNAPSGLTFNDGQSYGPCAVANNVVTCPLGTLAAGQFGSFLIAFDTQTVPTCTPISVVNSATITGTETDSNSNNNTSSTHNSPTRIDCPALNQCQDGQDNDFDGRIDFPNDPGCSSPTDTNESDDPACADRRDNDGDGLIDFPNDPGCTSLADTDESNVVLVQCNDGQDNDFDGRADFPNDPGCSSPTDTNEGDEAVCQDRRDNDGDGLIDFPNDPGCVSPTDNDEYNAPLTQCSDGIDNDGDWRVDMQDPGCSSPQDNNEGDDPACSDRRDNDGDGLTDWPLDPGCSSPTDTDEYNAPLTQCSDGIDNDGDWRVDMQDPGCSSPQDNNEGDDPACSDRIDNDNDGRVDFPLDPGCASPTDTDETDPFVPQCSDGRDNDFDGRIDFPADPGCSNGTDNDESNDPTQYGCIEVTKETFDPHGTPLPIAAQFTFILDATRVAYNNASGHARFEQVLPGSHSVAEIIPSGWTQLSVSPTGGTVNVVPGTTCAQVAFRNRQVFVANAQCADGFDNDGDGLTDYPQDSGCSSATDNDEYNTTFVPQCRDGADNDADGLIDFPSDPGCQNGDDNNEQNQTTSYACSDNVDNDNDGLKDYPADPGCSSATDTDEFNGTTTVACNDNVDNDNDGLTDYPADPGCSSATDTDEFNFRAARCSDGIDNDADGLVDYPQDTGCTTAYDDNEYNDRLWLDRWREFWNWNW